jgi:hypothetical protein
MSATGANGTNGIIVARYSLTAFAVSSRHLELITSAVTFAKRRSRSDPDGSQNVGILMAVETRIPTAQFSGKLEISCREAEVLLSALSDYSENFGFRPKHQSLFQELQHLASLLEENMEGRRMTSIQEFRLKPKTSW